ncbi:MAG: hypothetical protein Q8R82_18975, partial [Hyphomonadaceae bacterium]|nr:hypothetical protein [Hyphomonadaceae bacterium]
PPPQISFNRNETRPAATAHRDALIPPTGPVRLEPLVEGQMIRTFLAALALLTATACTYGSAVDMAPKAERIPKRAVSSGDFCGVEGDKPPFTVVSSSDCMPVFWDQSTRTYTVTPDPEDREDTLQVAPVSLRGGLYLAQAVVDPDDKDAPAPYQLFLLISEGNAFALLPVLEDGDLSRITARHPEVVFRQDGAGVPYIAAGERPKIKAFLREAAIESLRLLAEDAEPLVVGVRDKAGAADHPASSQQERDIAAVLKLARDLSPH